MPLPDERPRASVANLIGRFEQQTKRQSLAGSSPVLPIRTLSVASQNTGDSAKEEAKEKREWPPNAAATASKDTPRPAPVRQGTTTPPASSQPAAAPAPVAVPIVTSVSAPEIVTSQPAEPAPIQVAKSPAPSRAPGTPSRTTSRLPVSQSTPNARGPSTPAKPKAPPASSFKPPPPAKPLKAQNTGQSTTSTTSTVVRTKPTPRATPSTPSRPKTPSVAGTARPKTPSSTPRPKTPSTGLYAPTAASLAKARGAAPPVPSPSRRTSTAPSASAALERLSKPTAASASKARAPVVVASPARKSTAPARGAAPTRAMLKPRVGLAPAQMKQEKAAKESAVIAAAAGSGAGAGAVAAAAAENGGIEIDEPAGNGVETHMQESCSSESEFSVGVDEHQSHPTESEEPIESYDDDFLDDTMQRPLALAGAVLHAERTPTAEAHPAMAEQSASHASPSVEEPVDEATQSPEAVPTPPTTESVPVEVEAEVRVDVEGIAESDPSAPDLENAPGPGTDIEDLVHMLEATSVTRRSPSIASIPDESD